MNSISVLIPALPSAASIIPYLERIDQSRIYSNYGPLWREFREGLGQYVARRTGQAAPEICITSNGTTAIELALRARRRPEGRYCLMPAYTFIATAHAICNAGLEPYLLDVDPGSLALTPAIAARTVERLPERPAAVVPVSPFGCPIDIPAWEEFEREYEVPVVFDAAAAATQLDYVGHQPVCVSLHATKVLGIGEGGAVLTTDSALAERMTAMSGFGFMGPDRLSCVRGGNYRVSEYAAAVGLAALAEIDAKVETLRNLLAVYQGRLADAALRFQDGVGSRWVTMTLNVVLPRSRVEEVVHGFDRDGIGWRRWWGWGCHRQPAFADCERADLSVADDVAFRVIGVPFHTLLTKTEIDAVCKHLG